MSVTIHTGDAMIVLCSMQPQSINCCVTSPPYFGLRDYGVDGQIGLEPTPVAYVAKLVNVFREVRRVMRDDGTLWLNLGDSYAGKAGGAQGASGDRATRTFTGEMGGSRGGDGLKPKDLIGIPWRVAFALQADGWYLRQDIIWHKPNPMPESVTDRCTKAHEYIFLLSKSARYYFDNEAIKEPSVDRTKELGRAVRKRNSGGRTDGYTVASGTVGNGLVRNRRDVWTVTTKPYAGAHFATFPPDLIRPCILAGCPVGGTVLDPFGGSGTVAEVAAKAGRNAVLVELNPQYVALAEARMDGCRDMFSEAMG